MDEPVKQLCSIRIMFPVDSDDQAIEYKKRMSALLAEIPDSQIQFSLMSPSRSETRVPPVQ